MYLQSGPIAGPAKGGVVLNGGTPTPPWIRWIDVSGTHGYRPHVHLIPGVMGTTPSELFLPLTITMYCFVPSPLPVGQGACQG